MNRYAYMIRHAEPLMKRRICDLRCPDVRRWHDRLTLPHRLPAGAGGSRRPDGRLTASCAFEAFVALRACLTWSRMEGLISDNPASRLRIKIRREPRRELSLAELAKLWPELARLEAERVARAREWGREDIDLVRSPFQALRLILLTGCRLGEAVLALVEQAATGAIVWPRYKGHGRSVSCAARSLQVIAEQRAVAEACGSPYLFPSPRNPRRHISKHYVWATFAEACERVGIKASPHYLRHTIATKLYRRGFSRAVLSELLGQVDPESLETYLHCASPLAQEAVDDYERSLEGIID